VAIGAGPGVTAWHRTLAPVEPALDRFRHLVLADPALRSALRAEEHPTRFAVRAVALAHVRGIDLALDDVEAALADARLRWLARWV
jgi:hypothetical protein